MFDKNGNIINYADFCKSVTHSVKTDFFSLRRDITDMTDRQIYERVLYFHSAVATIEKPKAEPKNDSGFYGKEFEKAVKHYLNGNRGNSSAVSAKGKHDVKYHGLIFEIKSNCGEINSNINSNDYVIYTMDNKTDYERPERAHVLTVEQFINVLESCGLIRYKTATNGATVKAIQSYKNSKRKSALFASMLEQFETLEQFASEH